MSSFDLLSKQMQKKIWDMKWDSFTAIQDKAIPVIINTNKDVIITSGTASGKTEAVFLPILTLVEETARTSLKVMYISPLKALINNQFERIYNLCNDLEIAIHCWHGDVDMNKKKKLLSNPAGILQITPESIESIFINRTERADMLFKDIEFIVIDEIHSFLDSGRGIQLCSLLYRMESYCNKAPRIVGLSATVENFEFIKRWVNPVNEDNVEIIQEFNSDKELYYNLMHISTEDRSKKPVEMFEDLRNLTREYKAIIFCNSRGEVEETTVFLNRLAKKEGAGETYFAHHSSIDKKEREYVEKNMLLATVPKSIVATSSLELGIDIGDVQLVCQIDSTFTVSSLKQRLGRSGRKKGDCQILQLYTTTNDRLLQSLSVMELLLEKWIEPAQGYKIPYDILFHQIISICHEKNGLNIKDLLNKISSIFIFDSLELEKIEKLINYMVSKDYLEVIKGENEYIVGLEGERLLRSKEFYSVFMTSQEYTVQYGNKKIGQLDKGFIVHEGDSIILAGKLWTIISLDSEKNKIYVEVTSSAKPPRYFSGGGKIHSKILEKVMEILCSNNQFNYINDVAVETLNDIRKKYNLYNVNPGERIIWNNKNKIEFESFTGTVVSNTITWMLRAKGVNAKNRDLGRIEIVSDYDLLNIFNEIKVIDWNSEELLKYTSDNELFKSKYSEYLPEELQIKMHIENELDIKGAKEFLQKYKIRVIEN